MTEAGTLCTNADVLKKAGANANATAITEEYTNVYIKEAEAFICASGRYDFVTNYATLSTVGKEFLRDVTSSYAAMLVVQYDMSGYLTRAEAQTMLDVNYSIVVDEINLLRDEKFKSFIQDGVVD